MMSRITGLCELFPGFQYSPSSGGSPNLCGGWETESGNWDLGSVEAYKQERKGRSGNWERQKLKVVE